MVTDEQSTPYDVLIIGAGLTGLTTAYRLVKQGKRVAIVEKAPRVGGQIETRHENGFTYEVGPNTGVLGNSEVVAFLKELSECRAEVANKEAKQRLIYKAGTLHPLPSGIISGLKTPLFSWRDKLGMPFEPLRKRGNNPDESIASLTRRRLGESFLHYAVDPFVSGIYAGNAETLVTRHALPKLYLLEQQYGSFMMGGLQKREERKLNCAKGITKEVFSVQNGLGTWVGAIEKSLTTTYADRCTIFPNSQGCSVAKAEHHLWKVHFNQYETACTLTGRVVIPTVGGYAYAPLLPFVPKAQMEAIGSLPYAGVVQVSIGVKESATTNLKAFGALMPSIEQRRCLGILFLSACFTGRAPKGEVLLSMFLGGIKHPEVLQLSDKEIGQLVTDELDHLFGEGVSQTITLFKIHRHPQAIPQYTNVSDTRIAAIAAIEQTYGGLLLGGNIHGGIGMADRVQQAYGLAQRAVSYLIQ